MKKILVFASAFVMLSSTAVYASSGDYYCPNSINVTYTGQVSPLGGTSCVASYATDGSNPGLIPVDGLTLVSYAAPIGYTCPPAATTINFPFFFASAQEANSYFPMPKLSCHYKDLTSPAQNQIQLDTAKPVLWVMDPSNSKWVPSNNPPGSFLCISFNAADCPVMHNF
jgi:hypothetical protein